MTHFHRNVHYELSFSLAFSLLCGLPNCCCCSAPCSPACSNIIVDEEQYRRLAPRMSSLIKQLLVSPSEEELMKYESWLYFLHKSRYDWFFVHLSPCWLRP